MARRPMLTSAAAINAASNNNTSGMPVPALDGTPGQTVFGEDLNMLDNQSADNRAMSPYWTLVSDIVDGAEAMRARHNKYLPQFPNEDDNDYAFRWTNSKFTNVYRDVLENLASKPFTQEVTLIAGNNVQIPAEIETFIEDVDGSGSHITVFAVDTFFNGINSALDWVWVDFPSIEEGERVRTVADEKRLGIRPFWTHVLASNMLDVRSRVINGKERLTYVRMQEFEPDGKYIRIMRSDGYVAAWELYKEVTAGVGRPTPGTKFVFVGTGKITIDEIPLVPFITGRRKGRSWQFLPMLKDAAEMQVELYQQESGLKNVEALSGFPMLVGKGVKPQLEGTGKSAKPMKLGTGPQTTLYGGVNDGVAGEWVFIAPDAALLKFLLEHVNDTVDQIRELGRNPLTAQSGNLTVVTAATAAKKGNSAVQMWAFSLKDCLENCLVLTGKWMNITKEKYDPQVNVFTDFDVEGQEADVANLIEMRKNKEISSETFWREMVRRGVLSGEFDADVERNLLLDDIISPEGTVDGLTPPTPPVKVPTIPA